MVLGWTELSRAASTDAAVSGVVRDNHGTPQMGALIELLSADAATVASTLTDDHGRYIIPAVLPGKYQLRATAAFLVPLTRGNLRLQAGAQAVINLTMSTLFEAVNWLPTQGRRADEPTDDWKWTLRSTASRPLLRLTDENGQEVSSSAPERRGTVSQGRVEVTNGDGAFAQGGMHQILMIDRTFEDGDGAILRADIADLGSTASPRFSADVDAGYERRSQFGSTRLVAGMQTHPELTVAGGNTGYAVLQMASTQQMSIGDAVMIDAGTLLAAERLAATKIEAQPYVRVSVRPDDDLLVVYRYASGRELQSSDDLDHLKPANPVVADAQGRPLSTRGMHHELSVSKKLGNNSVLTGAAYIDRVNEESVGGSGILDMKAEQGMTLVADPVTGTFELATGQYAGRGLSLSLEQTLTSVLGASIQYDLGTALERAQDLQSLAEAAAQLHAQRAQAVTVVLHGKLMRSGTTMRAEYRWQPQDTLTQVNAYNADPNAAYLTFYVRQRLGCLRFLPHGVDAVVEATNLLEQGYQPVLAPDGHTLFLAQMPRAIQGGVAFNF
jgi:hypothetical protein